MASFIDFTLLFDLGLILFSATLFNYLARFFKQPNLLAYLLAGIFIGPVVLGSLGLNINGIPIGITKIDDVVLLSELGVAFLLFGVGVETDFSKLMGMGKTLFFGSIIQVLLTLSFSFLGTTFLGLGFEQGIFVGLILAFSSTLIVVKILSDAHQINTLQGRMMIGFLLVQDLLVMLVLPLANNFTAVLDLNFILIILGKGILIIAIAYLMNKAIYPSLYKFAVQSDELLFLASISSAFIFILLAVALEFPVAVGAFIAGVSLSTLPYSFEVFNKIRGVRDFFATIFFVTLGIQITFNFSSIPLELMLFILAIVFLLKPLIFFLITLFSGYGGKISLLVALGLAQVSEFSFILANSGKTVIDATPNLYSFLLLTIAFSMIASPYLHQHSNKLYSWLDKFILTKFFPKLKDNKLLHHKLNMLESIPEKFVDHLVIVGGGTMGYAIASIMKGKKEFILIDHDPEIVFDSIKKGFNSVYGEANNPEILEKVKIKDAKLLILAIPDVKIGVSALNYARKENPKITVFARAHYYRDALKYYENGTDFVVMPHIIGSNEFIKQIAEFLETGKIRSIFHLEEEFKKYLHEKAKEEKSHFGY
ncbi:MAG: cation:proton antiporter [Candidatus Diapherotrites archaeon]|nr:cation:proton antiporter [Candidatus Diapherotrites archaeon]